VENKAVTEEITGDMLRDRVDNFMVRLQRDHGVEGSRIEHAFILRLHAGCP
jgi:hypothetical protein